MSKGYEYMRQVVVRSVGVGGVVDDNGRSLRVIGNMPIKPGDTVWTDGRIVYGHRPVRPNVKPIIKSGGVPFYDDKGGGYFDDNAKKHGHSYPVVNVGEKSMLINGKDKLYLTETDGYLLDAEILIDNEGGEVGYIYAYVMNDDDIVIIDDEISQNTQIFIDSSIGNSENIRLENLDCANILLADILSECKAIDSDEPTNVITQLLHFRFIDNKGRWELYAGVRLDVDVKYFKPAEPGLKYYITQSTLNDRQLLRKEELAGQTLGYFTETVVIDSTFTRDESRPEGYATRHLEDFFGVIKISSDGEYKVIGRNYKARERWVSYTDAILEGEPHTTTDDQDIYKGYIVAANVGDVISTRPESTWKATGYYSYTCAYFLSEGSDEPEKGSTSAGLVRNYHYEQTSTPQHIHQTSDIYPAIDISEEISVDITDGYRMVLQMQSDFYIYKGDAQLLTYDLDPAPTYNPDKGLLKYGTSKYWRFPHLSLYEFSRANCILLAEYMRRMGLIADESLTTVEGKPINMRLRKMRRIKVSE